MAAKKVQITQVRSTIKRPKNQKLTIQALGLGKLNSNGKKNPDTYNGFDRDTLLSLFTFNASV